MTSPCKRRVKVKGKAHKGGGIISEEVKYIDKDTPEGKREIENLLLNAVFNSYGDLVPKPYRVDDEAYENYQKAILHLLDLKAKGKCSFEVTPLDDPYDTHCIYVQWILDGENGCELEKSEIINLVSRFETVAFYETDLKTWQLITHIYFPA